MSTPGGDRGADGERAGVEERAVAEVLDDVVALDEGRHADPLGALVAHRGEPDDVADPLGLHQGDHGVAADAGTDQRALGHVGAEVVRAAGAEERRAVDRQRDQRADLARRAAAGASRSSPRRAASRRRSGSTMASASSRPYSGISSAPCSSCLPTTRGRSAASYRRSLMSSSSVGVLLLDDDDLGEAAGEVAHLLRGRTAPASAAGGAGRRRAREVVVGGEPEQAQRLAELVVGVAAGDDADPVVVGGHRDPVEPVDHAVAVGQVAADLLELALHLERDGVERGDRCGWRTTACRRTAWSARPAAHGRVDVDRAGAVGDGGDDLQRRPRGRRRGDRAIAWRPSSSASCHVAGVQDRHVQVDERRRRSSWAAWS